MIQTQYAWPNQSSGAMSVQTDPFVIPRMDVIETQNELIYIVEMPGIDSNKLNVEAKGNYLIVTGEAEKITHDENLILHHQERVCTKFQRIITLNDLLAPDQAQAKLKNGVLHITFSKDPQTENTKKISIKED